MKPGWQQKRDYRMMKNRAVIEVSGDLLRTERKMSQAVWNMTAISAGIV
jgi:hypothetical protein